MSGDQDVVFKTSTRAPESQIDYCAVAWENLQPEPQETGFHTEERASTFAARRSQTPCADFGQVGSGACLFTLWGRQRTPGENVRCRYYSRTGARPSETCVLVRNLLRVVLVFALEPNQIIAGNRIAAREPVPPHF
jgi:hypothetical protein